MKTPSTARTAAGKSRTPAARSATASTGKGTTTSATPSRLRERDVEDYLCRRVKAMGGEVRKVKWIGRNGAPDRLVMLPKRTTTERVGRKVYSYATHLSLSVWVELKAPGKKPEPHQLREHKRMRAMGQRVEVIDSLEGVDALLA